MKTYELQRTKIRVNRDTWRRTLVNLFQRDKDIEALKLALKRWVYNATNRDSEYIKNAEFAGWSRCLQEIRSSVAGYPDQGGDLEVMESIQTHIRQARAAGREEAINELRSLGENGVSGVRLADMVHRALSRKDDIKRQREKAGTLGRAILSAPQWGRLRSHLEAKK